MSDALPRGGAPPRDPFGTTALSPIDKLGVWLSQRAIKKYLPRKPDLDVLELGCGLHAKNLIGLQPLLRRGVGVDFRISDAAKSVPKLEFLEGPLDAASSKLSTSSFDAILFISVLEHLWDPLPTLVACDGWLRRGGVLLINVPTWRGKVALEFSAFRLGLSPKVEMDDHKMYYDVPDLWPLLVRAGFAPSTINMHYHKLGLNLFAVIRKP